MQSVATLLNNDNALEVAPFSISRDVAALLPIYITCHVQEMTREVVRNSWNQFQLKEFLITS